MKLMVEEAKRLSYPMGSHFSHVVHLGIPLPVYHQFVRLLQVYLSDSHCLEVDAPVVSTLHALGVVMAVQLLNLI